MASFAKALRRCYRDKGDVDPARDRVVCRELRRYRAEWNGEIAFKAGDRRSHRGAGRAFRRSQI